MQFEDLDKKIKAAADHHHPAYDEQAWDRMEKLLDKHLPVKDDRRRRILFFLLLFLIAGLGTWLLISKPWQSKRKMAETTTVPAGNRAGPSSADKNRDENTGPLPADKENSKNGNTDITAETHEPALVTDKNPDIPAVKKDPAPNKTQRKANKEEASYSVTEGNKKSAGNNKNKTNNEVAVVETPVSLQNPVSTVNSGIIQKDEPEDNNKIISGVKDLIAEKPVEKQEPVTAKANETENKNPVSEKKKNKNGKKNSLFFSLSSGPDLSFVGSGNSSKMKLLAGGGVGFTFKEKFTLRTGFYTGRKIYSAKPSDYKAPPEFYQFYPYLEKVNANCRVYEIPLSLSYNFGKKQNWFVSAGVSSFLMNEESYDYIYKYTPTGNTYTNNWTIKNQNAHYFSVGTLSAGYRHDIGKRVTVMAEPYIKVPFAGVGYGKVKLNSGGVLFTVGIKAF